MKYVIRIYMLTLIVILSGCATTFYNKNSLEQDPFNKFNRVIFHFNDKLDNVAFKPLAIAYQFILPEFIHIGVNNFFGNITDLWSAINQILQGRINHSVSSFMRVVINSTFGFGGLLDISSEIRLQKQQSDFGQTLGIWGISSGPYIVLPIFGPSTLRDTIALPIDIYGNLWFYKKLVRLRSIGTALAMLDKREQLLNTLNLLEDTAFDKYDFYRTIYLQSRQIHILYHTEYIP